VQHVVKGSVVNKLNGPVQVLAEISLCIPELKFKYEAERPQYENHPQLWIASGFIVNS
jgi:hypothetical protein